MYIDTKKHAIVKQMHFMFSSKLKYLGNVHVFLFVKNIIKFKNALVDLQELPLLGFIQLGTCLTMSFHLSIHKCFGLTPFTLNYQ